MSYSKELVKLSRQVASARNYLYEATMGDYSMESVNRAMQRRDDLVAEAEDLGLEFDDLAWWDAARGAWYPTMNEEKIDA